MNGWNVRHSRPEVIGSSGLTVAGLLVAIGVFAPPTASTQRVTAPTAARVLETAQVALTQDGTDLIVLVLDTAPDALRICPVKSLTSPRVGCLTAKQLRERAR